MPKLPQISGTLLIKALKKEGWIEVSQKGSHIKLIKTFNLVGKSTIIIPQHKVIKKGTLSRILKDAGVTVKKLKDLL